MIFLSIALWSLSAATLDFDKAKQLADRDEGALVGEMRAQLVSSQGGAAKVAFEACTSTPPVRVLPSFAIVMELNRNGQVTRSWREGDSEFAVCVEKRFRKATFFTPPGAPFYTSFVYHTEVPV